MDIQILNLWFFNGGKHLLMFIFVKQIGASDLFTFERRGNLRHNPSQCIFSKIPSVPRWNPSVPLSTWRNFYLLIWSLLRVENIFDIRSFAEIALLEISRPKTNHKALNRWFSAIVVTESFRSKWWYPGELWRPIVSYWDRISKNGLHSVNQGLLLYDISNFSKKWQSPFNADNTFSTNLAT